MRISHRERIQEQIEGRLVQIERFEKGVEMSKSALASAQHAMVEASNKVAERQSDLQICESMLFVEREKVATLYKDYYEAPPAP